MRLRQISGWGRVPSARSHVEPISYSGEISLDGLGRGAVARGLGRSYGDCAQNSGGVVFDATPMSHITLDDTKGTVDLGAGASIGDLLVSCVPQGWFPPVTPGTKHVTIGGAIAADVHGKNHHRDGTIARHITKIELFTSKSGTETLGPDDPVFRATTGGLGLTGIVLSAELSMIAIETSKMVVDTIRTPTLDDMMAAMTTDDDGYQYSVAWIDLMATGASLGRGVLTRANHAPATALNPNASSEPLVYPAQRAISIPDVLPSGLVNRMSVQAFNELWYRKSPNSREGELQTINEFFYPLDMLNNWNRLYGRRGFLQYQFAIPDSGTETLRAIVADISRRRYPTFLAVLKRFGPGSGLLSFPIAGWTLALDIPIGVPDLASALADFDEQVAAVGGRVYLAKDSRLRPETFRSMYPEFETWLGIRDSVDPEGVWRSDLQRRLAMTRSTIQ